MVVSTRQKGYAIAEIEKGRDIKNRTPLFNSTSLGFGVASAMSIVTKNA